MIKANELRIGNWIKIGGEWKSMPNFHSDAKIFVSIETQVKVHASLIADICCGSIEARPIPLTPEIMENVWAQAQQLKVGALKMDFRFNSRHVYSEIGGIYLGDRISHL